MRRSRELGPSRRRFETCSSFSAAAQVGFLEDPKRSLGVKPGRIGPLHMAEV